MASVGDVRRRPAHCGHPAPSRWPDVSKVTTPFCEGTLAAVWRSHEPDDVCAHACYFSAGGIL